MVKGALWKNFFRTVWRSFARFLAILSIIALGAGFFVGLRETKTAMTATAQDFLTESELFDFHILNTYGYEQEDVEAFQKIAGVRLAEGAVSMDAILQENGEEWVYKLLSLPESVNLPTLRAGRMPEKPGECLGDFNAFQESDIGRTLTLSEGNEAADTLTTHEFTIVGLATSPVYINFQRGNTSLGSGKLAGFLYVLPETFALDGVYTEVYLRLDENYDFYAEKYDNVLSAMTDPIEKVAKAQAQRRYDALLADAEKALSEGQAEFDEKEQDANRQLSDAKQELESGSQEIAENRQTLLDAETELLDSQAAVDAGWNRVLSAQKELKNQRAAAEKQLADASKELEENLRKVSDGQKQTEAGLSQVAGGLTQIAEGLAQAQSGKEQLEILLQTIGVLEQASAQANQALDKALAENPDNEALLQAKKALDAACDRLQTSKQNYEAQYSELLGTIAQLEGKQSELTATKTELQETQTRLQEALLEIADGLAQLETRRAEAEAQLRQGQTVIDNTVAQLVSAQKQITDGKEELQTGKEQLQQAETQLQEGQAEYDSAKQEADSALEEGRVTLEDAREQVEKLRAEMPDTYVLDRNTNTGYVSFENDAGIVEGISRVFPMFFFLVAAMVCITTMTKMVDEERTQIGVLKALGYSSGAITGKYLAYSGLASMFGCVLGELLGSWVFPSILWQVYGIMYDFPCDIAFVVDWRLCVLVVSAYVFSILLVTWLSCRMELGEVPAQLIRPKAPKTGKRVLLERLPVWKHLRFLQKVTARNVFRYKKRLYMTILGVGGCTALLVTGFGVRDSIANIVDEQFDEISVYDMSVSFTGDQSAAMQESFRQAAGENADVLFLHSSAADLLHGKSTKSVTVLAAEASFDGFMNLTDGEKTLSQPGVGEALLSRGVAADLGIGEGDLITVQTADMERMTLKVAGVFRNKFYHYVIVSPETIAEQLGKPGAVNTAYVTAPEGSDVYSFSTKLSGQAGVARISVNQALRAQVGSMFDSLNYVVALIVICAGLLAFIVLYNLTNININERQRELATLKVLGFTPVETASYVFWENLLLSGGGALLGLLMGKFLHAFVMSQIRVDMVSFDTRVTFWSYCLSFLLTLIFAGLVDLILTRNLERISMTDALKSVE